MVAAAAATAAVAFAPAAAVVSKAIHLHNVVRRCYHALQVLSPAARLASPWSPGTKCRCRWHCAPAYGEGAKADQSTRACYCQYSAARIRSIGCRILVLATDSPGRSEVKCNGPH